MSTQYISYSARAGSGGVTTLNGLSGALTLVGAGGISITPSGTTITITQSATLWGTIGGTLSNQTDLQNALNLKANLSGATFTGAISATNLSGTNTGDQTITLTGQVTGSGTGSFAATLNSGAATSTQPLFANGSGGAAYRSIVAGDLPSLSGTYVPQSEVGAANGVASLDSGGKVPVAQLPSSVFIYQGTWNPTTNTPTLIDGTGVAGYVYWVSAAAAGPIVGLSNPSMVNFQIGDLVLYNGTQWELSTPAAGVQSVNGSTGVVTVNAINQLTGDGTAGPASGSQSVALTLATVATPGTATKVTFNAKGLVTSGTTLSSGDIPNNAANTTGTAANITATSNSTLTTLSALSLPGSQVTGNISGNAANVTGTVAVANGGTGQTSFTNGQLLIGNTSGNTLTPATITAGTGISVTNGGGSITIANTGLATVKAPTIQQFTSGSGTYTLPTSPSPLYIKVTMVGGGAGGSGGGSSGVLGSAGNASSFGTSLLVANGGGAPASTNSGGLGGTASLGSGPVGIALQGATGGGGGANAAASSDVQGGIGGSTPFGGAGSSYNYSATASSATPNTGSGGGGGAGNGGSANSGGGGGAAGYVNALITSPSSTYAYVVGAGGSGGASGGGSNQAGGSGGSGYILVEEFYQ